MFNYRKRCILLFLSIILWGWFEKLQNLSKLRLPILYTFVLCQLQKIESNVDALVSAQRTINWSFIALEALKNFQRKNY